MLSFPKDLALVTVGPRVGRRYGDFVARNVVTGWHPWFNRRRHLTGVQPAATTEHGGACRICARGIGLAR